MNASLSMTDTGRTLSGDISHFSHIFADSAEAVTIKMTLDATERPVGGVVTAIWSSLPTTESGSLRSRRPGHRG